MTLVWTCHLQPFVSAYSALCTVSNAALNLKLKNCELLLHLHFGTKHPAKNVKIKLHFCFKSYCCVTQAQI